MLSPTRKTLALITSSALIAALAATSVAAPASAAKPRCAGKVATIVGTAGKDVIRGTAKADVIVARGGSDKIYGRGGNDTICAGGGNDTVYAGGGSDTVYAGGGSDTVYAGGGSDRVAGGSGHDRVYGASGSDNLSGNDGADRIWGGDGNDAMNGGRGYDRCYQGSGTGSRTGCELPISGSAKVLAIAYSDLDGNDEFSAGDVMIARLVDTSADGKPSAGDTVHMGRYPTKFDASTFKDWGVKLHQVVKVKSISPTEIEVLNGTGGSHRWVDSADEDQYWELKGSARSQVEDWDILAHDDDIDMKAGSPSKPTSLTLVEQEGATDDDFVDVDLFY